MNAGLSTALMLVLILALGAVPAAAVGNPPDAGVQRLIVQLRDARVLDALPVGVQAHHALQLPRTHVLEVATEHADAVLETLSRDPDVAYAERDAPAYAVDFVPNDPGWSSQWGAQKIEAPAAWDVETGATTTTVAVLDTGVNPHEDLNGAMLNGFNAIDGTSDVTDSNGHGTAVAGVSAARGNNALGIAGLCWACSVLPVKVLGNDGAGYQSHVASGIVWATDQGADVINTSLAGDQSTTTLANAVAYAHTHGVVVVAAAGNAGTTTKSYPAAYDTVIGVAASDQGDNRYSWSNYGSWVDVAAPGCTMTTLASGDYGEPCGTSFSAPLVAGIAALALAQTPTATPAQVRDALMATAADRSYVASGRVRAGLTVLAVAAAVTTDLELAPIIEPVPILDPDPLGEPAPEPEPEPEPEPVIEPAPAQADACPAGEVPPAGFSDVVPGSTHATAIDCIVWHELSGGLGDGRYGPARGVRRDQMAAFLARTLQTVGVILPDGPPQAFSDTDGNLHERAINQLAALGVVQGGADGRYRPQATVRRDQMAAFLARAYAQVTGSQLPAGAAAFDDIAGNTHRVSIEALAAAGVVNGVGPRTYSPAGTVRRDQMASFLARTLETLTDVGHPPAPPE